MTRKRPSFQAHCRVRSKKNVMYESRSRHAKNRKRAPDGKFLPNTANLNCSDAMSDSTILKETDRGSRSRSQDKEKRNSDNKDNLDETDSICRGLSPNNLNNRESLRAEQSLNLTRNPSTMSTELFKNYESNDELEQMILPDKNLSLKKSEVNQDSHQLLNLNKWSSIDK